ncbi:hypothetical protein BST40_11710 [Mycobacterium persicum]|nr:hypothetical protein BST40_11710 [Mycobacterium persicum]
MAAHAGRCGTGELRAWAGPITHVLPAAGDEVSAAVAQLVGAYGQEYQAVVAQAAAFHNQFVQALAGASSVYAQADAANAALLFRPSNALTQSAPIPSQRRLHPAQLLGGHRPTLVHTRAILAVGQTHLRPISRRGCDAAEQRDQYDIEQPGK